MYKIQSFNENNIIIPEHIDITGEVDKLLQIIAEAEDKLSVMRKYYINKNEAKRPIKLRPLRGRKGSQGVAKQGLGSQKSGQLWQKCGFLVIWPQFGHKTATPKGVFRTLPNPPDPPGVATFCQ